LPPVGVGSQVETVTMPALRACSSLSATCVAVMHIPTIALGCSAIALDIAWLMFWMSALPLMFTKWVLNPIPRAIRAPACTVSLQMTAPHETKAMLLPCGTGGDCVGPSQLVMSLSCSPGVNSSVGE
jgi:hypothetical protein